MSMNQSRQKVTIELVREIREAHAKRQALADEIKKIPSMVDFAKRTGLTYSAIQKIAYYRAYKGIRGAQ